MKTPLFCQTLFDVRMLIKELEDKVKTNKKLTVNDLIYIKGKLKECTKLYK